MTSKHLCHFGPIAPRLSLTSWQSTYGQDGAPEPALYIGVDNDVFLHIYLMEMLHLCKLLTDCRFLPEKVHLEKFSQWHLCMKCCRNAILLQKNRMNKRAAFSIVCKTRCVSSAFCHAHGQTSRSQRSEFTARTGDDGDGRLHSSSAADELHQILRHW